LKNPSDSHYEEPPQCLVRIEGIAKRFNELTAQGGMKPTDRTADRYARLVKAAGSAEPTRPQTGVPYSPFDHNPV
jgi:hypothetical protein